MRTGRRPTVAAAMLMAISLGIGRPPGAAFAVASPVPAVAVADSAAKTTPTLAEAAPSAAEIATLRSRVGDGVARVRIGADAYDIRAARFTAEGVAFGRGDLRGVPGWDRGMSNGDDTRSAPLASPIGWDRIDRITVRKPCGLRGAVVGGLLGTAACGAVFALAARNGDDMGMGALAVLALPPMGAFLGGAVGMLQRRSAPGWQRAGTVRPGPVGPAGSAGASSLQAPAAAAPPGSSVQPGVLRDAVGNTPIRVWAGRDRYVLRQAQIEPAGVAFDPGDLQGHFSIAANGARVYSSQQAHPSSPIGWDRVDRIETWQSSARQGAKWGVMLVPAALVLESSLSGEGEAVLGAAVGGAVLGSMLGAGLGALVHRWKVEWQRPPSTSPVAR